MERHWIYQAGTHEEVVLHERQRIEFGASRFDFHDFCSYVAKVFIEYCKYELGESEAGKPSVESYPAAMTQDQWHSIIKEIKKDFETFLDISQPEDVQRKAGTRAMYAAALYFHYLWD